MLDWMVEGNTAVVTGAAGGLGLEAARRYAKAGMNVVIADKNLAALNEAADELAQLTGSVEKVLAQHTDVSSLDEVESLRDAAYGRFETVHCLMNNAGIAKGVGTPWENVDAARKLLDVNLWGIINGCNAFIPRMLETGVSGAVINTGSKQGITKPPGNFAYNLSKTGVLAYTESVAHAFRALEGCKLSAHLLVPGFVYTPMIASFLPEKPPGAWTPEQTIDFMLGRLANDDFYIICPDNDVTREMDEKRIQWAADDIIKNRPALSRWHPEFESAFEAFMSEK